MRVFCLYLSLVCATVALSGQTVRPKTDNADAVYKQLASRLREGDLTIDFKALRFACADARECEVRGNVTDLGALSDALGRSDWHTALEIAERMLKRGYADSETHADLVTIYAKLGDQKRSDFESAIVMGLLRSIRTSEGESKQRALEVISSREIWTTMVSMGLPYSGKGVEYQEFSEGSRRYALIKALDPKTNQVRQVYFNFDHVNEAKDKTNRP